MEGIARLPLADLEAQTWRQRTVKAAIDCAGIGVHSGRRIRLTIHPAPIGHGIVFHRSDLDQTIDARFDNVVDTSFCTVLAQGGARIGTVEHLMSALSSQGIDNALIEVNGPEVPILDGSAAPFLFLLNCAGIVEQDAPRQVIEISRTIRVTDGMAWAELRPLGPIGRADAPVLEIDVSVEFAAEAIGRQSASIRLTADGFSRNIAEARTFVQLPEIERLQAAGLAQGGSLQNAIVVDGASVLNPGGLRMENEFAAHKLLDAVGDLALAGSALHARFVAHRPGHRLNNRLLRTMFADPTAWRFSAIDPLSQAA
jgi:UDP-3-O-[3-hydroxymyristoyl] N-acetylglucosamine deacetylase